MPTDLLVAITDDLYATEQAADVSYTPADSVTAVTVRAVRIETEEDLGGFTQVGAEREGVTFKVLTTEVPDNPVSRTGAAVIAWNARTFTARVAYLDPLQLVWAIKCDEVQAWVIPSEVQVTQLPSLVGIGAY